MKRTLRTYRQTIEQNKHLNTTEQLNRMNCRTKDIKMILRRNNIVEYNK